MAENINVYRPNQSTDRESALIILPIKGKCRLWPEMYTYPFMSSLISRAFSISRWKLYQPKPSREDIKLFIQAPAIINIIKKKQIKCFP